MRATHLPLRVWIPVSMGLLALLLTSLPFVYDSFRTRHTVENQLRLSTLTFGANGVHEP